ncbi:MAG: 4Fe-4S dicluster domain-containing protein [Rikenellaceae bacterium]|nr:4Fe-4S dicluster domain-containing protein [Rikenellaceae bacterium]
MAIDRSINWGYSISRPRAVDMDANDHEAAARLLRKLPELQACIACGCCVATCTAGNLTDFNFRRVHTLVRRGEYKGAYDELNKCMLCGKCRLVCPRGINTRAVVMAVKRILGEY